MSSHHEHVAVIGAGVVGLTTALSLMDEGFSVTVYAEKFHPSLVSSAACAIFLPLWTTEQARDDYLTALEQWSVTSWAAFRRMVGPDCGIHWKLNHELFVEATEVPDYLNFMKDLMPDFVATFDEHLPLQPACNVLDGDERMRFKYRWSFQTLVIETPIYLPWLYKELIARGGHAVARRLDDLSDILSLPEAIVVNCSGLGGAGLFGDSSMRGVKGQLILHEPVDIDFAIGADAFCLIPRSDALILGSLTQDSFVDERPTKANWDLLWTTVTELCQEQGMLTSLPDGILSKSRLLGTVSGVRPYRKGGVRVEAEELSGKLVVHNYGHGGAGVTLSWGCAAQAAGLVSDAAGRRFAARPKGAGKAAHYLKYSELLEDDSSYFHRHHYFARAETPIHGWYLIRESSDLAQIIGLMNEIGADEFDYVIDPFAGSGTVGLAAHQLGVPFIGFDKLGSCVVGSRAKLMAWHMDGERLGERFASALERLDSIPLSSETIGLAGLRRRLDAIQSGMGREIDPEDYALLTAAFASAHQPLETSATDVSHQEFAGRLKDRVERICRELGTATLGTPSRASMLWGNSATTDWRPLIAANGLPTSGRALLLTSPMHVASAQETGQVTELVADEAADALVKNGFRISGTPYHSSPVRLPPELVGVSEVYFADLASVLSRFRQIAGRGSRVVVECENPGSEGARGNVDLLVCLLAEGLGFRAEKIRITHYIKSTGDIGSEWTPTRGVLIYLSTE